ncbi:lipoprotein 17-related variable surface protein [Mycoplasmopsis primatum]|uniref:lipoprotein 17-related variable surface protein n=1 Tax=Mycoplasmopsis primatum TaxID=55604 RepID=UPI0004953D72|nr:lipoprotein 17-related variable surface protein [Mycoplasmopsis primatum]
MKSNKFKKILNLSILPLASISSLSIATLSSKCSGKYSFLGDIKFSIKNEFQGKISKKEISLSNYADYLSIETPNNVRVEVDEIENTEENEKNDDDRKKIKISFKAYKNEKLYGRWFKYIDGFKDYKTQWSNPELNSFLDKIDIKSAMHLDKNLFPSQVELKLNPIINEIDDRKPGIDIVFKKIIADDNTGLLQFSVHLTNKEKGNDPKLFDSKDVIITESGFRSLDKIVKEISAKDIVIGEDNESYKNEIPTKDSSSISIKPKAEWINEGETIELSVDDDKTIPDDELGTKTITIKIRIKGVNNQPWSSPHEIKLTGYLARAKFDQYLNDLTVNDLVIQGQDRLASQFTNKTIEFTASSAIKQEYPKIRNLSLEIVGIPVPNDSEGTLTVNVKIKVGNKFTTNSTKTLTLTGFKKSA